MSHHAADTAGAAVRQANSAACLLYVRSAPQPVTVSEIAQHTGLSRPTVDAVMSDLAAGPVVGEAAPDNGAAAGRPARRYAFNADAGFVAGLDAGPHSVRVLISDLAGTVVARTQTRMPPVSGRAPLSEQDGGADRIAFVRDCLDKTLSDASIESVRAACVGVPGILDAGGRMASSLAVADWIGLDLADRLGTAWGCPVVLENDIKLAALAEHRVGSTGAPNLAFFQIGHRVSVALIMNGAILQGSHRLAGELGSLRGMKWTATSTRGQLRWASAPTAREVFALAAAQDHGARNEIDDFCREIAPKIATILLTVDPDVVIIGGGLSRAGADFLDPLRKAVHHVLMTPAKPELRASSLTSDGAVTGAIGVAFDTYSEHIFGLAGVSAPWPSWAPSPSQTATH